jgi:NAD(P)-dependent dehydrogenase (short-subunit alcohol dehydrogenase family)
MDELYGLNVKPVAWTTKFAFEAPTAKHQKILTAAGAVGFIGRQHHAAHMASKGAMISLTKDVATD